MLSLPIYDTDYYLLFKQVLKKTLKKVVGTYITHPKGMFFRCGFFFFSYLNHECIVFNNIKLLPLSDLYCTL